ncbi:MAG: response regulator [Opitutaceae bacterium]
MQIRVGIVEDDCGTRESVAAVLKGCQKVRLIRTFPDAAAALSRLPEGEMPDVILMDINLPGMNGVECTARLKRSFPKLEILMLTTYDDADRIFDSLRAGASGYLLKRVSSEELVEAIEQVHAGGSPMSMPIARKVVHHFHAIRQQKSEFDALTPRESEILTLLAKGYHYKEIADQLVVTVSTVRAHLHAVYGKLHVQSKTEAVIKYLGR